MYGLLLSKHKTISHKVISTPQHYRSITSILIMKFTIFALLGALASTGANQLRNSVRKLDGARAELDGTANISFAKCVEVTVQPDGDNDGDGDDDGDDDGDIQSAVLAGTARPVKSYAAFYTDDSASDSDMMLVGLGDYVAAKVTASAMKAQKLCETCRQFEETCNPEEEEEAEVSNACAIQQTYLRRNYSIQFEPSSIDISSS